MFGVAVGRVLGFDVLRGIPLIVVAFWNFAGFGVSFNFCLIGVVFGGFGYSAALRV